jgi:hypothetical protein
MTTTLNASTAGAGGFIATGDNSGSLALQTNGTTTMTLNTSGNVGIGTTSPNNRLSLKTTGGGCWLQTEDSVNTSGSNVNLFGSYGDGSAAVYTSGANPITFTTNNSERMRILSGGSVYIGTTTGLGSGRLQVYSAGVSVNGSNGNNTNGDINMVSQLGANCNNSTSYSFLAATGGADKCYILGNGNLQNVNNSYGTLSDIKLKENIVDATPKLADIMRLQVRNFNLKTEPNQKQIGFVAQEIEQVFPSIIEEISDLDENRNLKGTTTKGVKTSILVPMLVKAIQEQQALINTQAETINALTARVVALESK